MTSTVEVEGVVVVESVGEGNPMAEGDEVAVVIKTLTTPTADGTPRRMVLQILMNNHLAHHHERGRRQS